jgi:hypothetical protein
MVTNFDLNDERADTASLPTALTAMSAVISIQQFQASSGALPLYVLGRCDGPPPTSPVQSRTSSARLWTLTNSAPQRPGHLLRPDQFTLTIDHDILPRDTLVMDRHITLMSGNSHPSIVVQPDTELEIWVMLNFRKQL